MIIYCYWLTCFLVSVSFEQDFTEGVQATETYKNPWKGSRPAYFISFLYFSVSTVLSLGSEGVNIYQAKMCLLMIGITIISSSFFVAFVAVFYGLIINLNKVGNIEREQREEAENWLYKISCASGIEIKNNYEKKMMKSFEFARDKSVSEILEDNAFYRGLTGQLQMELKEACVMSLQSVFDGYYEKYSSEFVSKVIMCCKPIS